MRPTVSDRIFAALARTRIPIFGRPVSSFHLCGVTGLVLALGLSQLLVSHRGLSPWVMAALSASAVATFLALAAVTKVILGREALIYYHHEIAITAVAALGLWLASEPVLVYLDSTLLGIGIFLACGRIGCLMVGCCHGRPWSWGVRYTEAHAEEGFTGYYVGIRLFPVPVLESFWAFGLALVGSLWIFAGAAPGEAFTLYVVAYALARFGLEFLRGDPHRPFLGGFSEAQWISLAAIGLSVAGEVGGLLPFHRWHAGALVAMMVTMALVTFRRHRVAVPRFDFRHPHHVRELAEALHRIEESESAPVVDPVSVQLQSTSQGLWLSGAGARTGSGPVHHVSLSRSQVPLDHLAAQEVATVLRDLRPGLRFEIVSGRGKGVFHLLAEPGG